MKLTKEDVGSIFVADIDEIRVIGKINYEDGRFYFCQNKRDGSRCSNRLGYSYSWCVGDETDEIEEYDIKNLVIAPKEGDLLRIEELNRWNSSLSTNNPIHLLKKGDIVKVLKVSHDNTIIFFSGEHNNKTYGFDLSGCRYTKVEKKKDIIRVTGNEFLLLGLSFQLIKYGYKSIGIDQNPKSLIITDNTYEFSTEEISDYNLPKDWDILMDRLDENKEKYYIITGKGYVYETYDLKFKELNFKNERKNSELPNGTICKLIGICRHEYGDKRLFGLEDPNGNQVLISEEGIKPSTKLDFLVYKYGLEIGKTLSNLGDVKFGIRVDEIDSNGFYGKAKVEGFAQKNDIYYVIASQSGDEYYFNLETFDGVKVNTGETTLRIGNPEQEITISDGKVYFDEDEITITELERIEEIMSEDQSFFDELGYSISFPQVKIGCTTFTYEDLNELLTLLK